MRGEWTAHGIAEELQIARNIIDELIEDRGIEPYDTAGTYKYYFMHEIVQALMTVGRLDLTQERAKESIEKQRKMQRENDLAEGKLAPIEILTTALTGMTAQVVSVLNSLPINLKRRVPDLSATDMDWVKHEIAVARNQIAELKLPRGKWG